MRRVTALLLAVVVVGGAGIAATVALLDDNGDGRDGPSASRSTASTEPRPPAGSALVAGSVVAMTLDPTLLDPVSLPLTVEELDRGAASARIAPVLIDGREASVAWSGGTPLELEGSGTGTRLLSLDPVTVEISAEGIGVALDGVVGSLSPGAYRLTGSVAIGEAGLARPADAVSFEATAETTISFSGPAVTTVPARPARLEGPGSVLLFGDVEVTTEAADRRLSAFRFGPGPYRFDIVWAGDHVEIDGRLDGVVHELPATTTGPDTDG